jgi:C-terminal processing protease CtpA/Prc
VTSINDVPTGDILRCLLPLVRADGGNDEKRRSLLELRGRERFETMDLHLPFALPAVGQEASFLLDGTGIVRATLMTAEERTAARSSPTKRDGAPWAFQIDSDGLAVLTMSSWAMYKEDFSWEKWLAERLDALSSEKARALVIDIRGNEGGLQCGAPILARIVQAEIPTSDDQRRVRYRRVPDHLRPYLNTWDPTFYDWADALSGPDAEGFYKAKPGQFASEPIRPSGLPFRRPVVVLCDAANSSATFDFARLARQVGAKLVGSPTGGNQRGINASAFFFVRLPASGLEVDLPLVATFSGGDQPNAGVQPDVVVPLTRTDLTSPHDRVLEVARRTALA